MVVYLVLALATLVLLVWAGRRPSRAGTALRIGSGVFSLLAAGGAVLSVFRGAWPVSLILIALSAYLGQRARAAPPPSTGSQMSLTEARSMLGVPETADRAQIEAAYRRLMQRAHPDAGGSAGLAAQLNAARDRLLKT